MPLLTIQFPDIDPVIFEIGPIAVRWYALAYIAGILFAVWYAKRLVSTPKLWGGGDPAANPYQIDNLLLWSTLGVILGGRLGYVAFYSPAYFLHNPAEILALWSGGMSFHGGFLGVVVACWLYARRQSLSPVRLLDLAACGVPVGLGLGRLANFINAELYGRTTDVPWAMVFPGGGPEPRHPSQLYEAVFEGLVLFALLRFASHRFGALARPGLCSGLFAVGYAASRLLVEFAREPDAHIGYLAGGWLTLGMVLSLPLLAVGAWLIGRSQEVR
ncbi:MAG TPA: prolipoprotein diacylglyceryl transferase [Aestuariivirgaceae bacterium]|nr:prolipoprotein diacylglyceryl transferase [Aestuariivirgaceae bacterium]